MMNEDQVKEIIQRWRNTQEDDLKPEDYQQFKTLGCASLSEGESQQLLKFIQDEKNQVIVKSMGCVILAPLLNEVVKKAKGLDQYQAAITHLTRTCRPNELLDCMLEIIEGIDPGAISETILALLPHLQSVLLRLDEGKAACVGSTLSALQKQLSRLPVPYTEQQEEADEYGLCRCSAALTVFTEPFVEEVKRTDGNCAATAEDEELKIELLKFCMRSLREPLLEAELKHDRRSPLWLFAVEIMVTLSAIKEPLPELLFFSSLRKNILMDNNQFKEARACLAYLLFVQLITIDNFPAVFSHVFILQCNMEYISQLLSSKKESHLLKGLALFTKSLERVQDNSLPVSLLDLKSFYSVTQNLRRVLTDCPIQHLVSASLVVNMGKMFDFCYTIKGIHLFALPSDHCSPRENRACRFSRCMLKTSNHAGIESYIIKNIRNQFELSMKWGNANEWFLGTEFISLMTLVLCLPQGAQTDLLSSMDKIMESLNLLRYVLIRDEELRTNEDVWEELCRIKEEYLKMLRVCISISRAYYSSELKALREDQKLKAKARDAARPTKLVKSITVRKEKVSNMSPEVQHQVLQSALVTFDLMESLIARIEEITEEKQNKLN
ncbi:glomulin-like isoform X2 [Astatotilapia calliptera]|uniref:glomulin-like isoform X2 n=1 Tax=Astatotilapia calliptera TaxID=8154 RepID=UPI000E403F02|nr:glomulin-like isoform X2 [Astatotilapia calliptera]